VIGAPARPPPQETRRSGVAAASKPRRQPPDKRPVKPGSWPRTLPRKGDLHRSLPLPRRHAGAGSRLIPGVNDSGRRFFSITTKISSRSMPLPSSVIATITSDPSCMACNRIVPCRCFPAASRSAMGSTP